MYEDKKTNGCYEEAGTCRKGTNEMTLCDLREEMMKLTNDSGETAAEIRRILKGPDPAICEANVPCKSGGMIDDFNDLKQRLARLNGLLHEILRGLV